MKFNDVSTKAQVVLMASAFGGAVEVLSRSMDDEGRKFLEVALQRVGLTVGEFQTLINDLDDPTSREIVAVMETAQAEDSERDAEAQRQRLADEEDDEDEEAADDSDTDADGWQDLHEDRICLICNREYCVCH
ncbi:hypothetical protein MPK66_gp315 [Erwinia phage pEa_SNUABM_2]|uniref:Uncharacterized protein n=1 Tax=Erwinia phage pEa_SNUABM_2 TaxID=2869547 RepID=A0AAE8C1Q4_9CAUD|nr:hypothetical protein MPK66_gp315 [Erwinia phage pEa_SNUABM_2]QZE59559.1 hypothetical protein pEaSNUABM2_00315 [Erwinia phage pEa_SNUABM_2]QZE59896.1 hypothetical protein pEaSNUABM39_00316 [Erwinia phage pEa_SNUABM_39]